MIPFLQQVATHYVTEAGNDLGKYAFIFPNRRASVFFRKYLKEVFNLKGPGHAIFAPKILTINDFFYRAAGMEATDRIQLLIELYDVYKALNPKAEPLDEFVFWGDILLGDFDDIDKYRVDAKGLLANIADLKAIQDSFSYLSDRQREAIESFIRHFRDNNGRLTVDLDTDNPRVKERFLHIWNILYSLYTGFRERLGRKGMAYEGMVYRDLAERLDRVSAPDIFKGKHVFIGLNALNECERTVLAKMRDAGMAEFVWDYVSEMIRDKANKSSKFMEKNVVDFPQAFPLEDNPKHVPAVEVISIASSVCQAKMLPSLLADTDPGNPVGTAIVLPDENLLTPVLHSIPEAFQDINVTMGFPLQAGAVFTLMKNAAALQLNIREKDGALFFYHRPVTALFSSSLLRRVLSPEETTVIDRIKAAARYYIPISEFQGRPVLETLFQPVVTNAKEPVPGQIDCIATWQKEVLRLLGERISADPDLILELDLTKRYFTAVEILSAKKGLTDVLPATWFRLLERLLGSQSVPFNGEPLKGLQVMGPLETRALDFRDVILLSGNEGTFPRHSVSSSFVPPELRSAFGLPTYEFQDAVWAYYFYRLLQRADRVRILYDSRTEGVHSGEESRYIKQLQYYFRIPVVRRVVHADLMVSGSQPIPKDESVMKALHERSLSASSLKNYLDCPARFYYSFVRRLREEDEVAETLDEAMIGRIYHWLMQSFYLGGEALEPEFPIFEDGSEKWVSHPLKSISAGYIDGLLKDEERIRRKIDFLIHNQMHTMDISGRNLVVENVLYEYAVQTLKRDKELIEKEGDIRILGLEKEMTWRFEGFAFVGFIDRMDSQREGVVRIVDYKTGLVKKEDTDITDENADKIADQLFGTDNKKRPKIAFQLFLYDMFTENDPTLSGAVIKNSIYAPSTLFVAPVTSQITSRKFCDTVKERLAEVLREIDNPSIPFSLAENPKDCKYCPFKLICGR